MPIFRSGRAETFSASLPLFVEEALEAGEFGVVFVEVVLSGAWLFELEAWLVEHEKALRGQETIVEFELKLGGT